MKTSTLAAVIGNIVSLLAVWLVNFGIELTPQQQAEIVSALLVIVNTCALIIPALCAWWAKRSGGADAQSGHARLSLVFALCVASFVGVLSLPGCGLQPQNSREALALGYTAHTALTRSVTAATTSGTINVGQAERAREALAKSLYWLDVSQSLITTDQPTGEALERANELLLAVEQILLESQP